MDAALVSPQLYEGGNHAVRTRTRTPGPGPGAEPGHEPSPFGIINRNGVTIGCVRNLATYCEGDAIATITMDDEAVAAGFLDRVEPEPVPAAQVAAQRLGQLDRAAHAATKLRIRGPVVDAILRSLEDDARALAASGG